MVSLLGTLPSRPKTGCQTAICTATPTAAGPRQLRSEPGVEDGRTDGRTRPHGSGMSLGPERDGRSGAARSVDGPGDVYAQRDEPHTQRRKPRESRRNPRFRKAGRGGGQGRGGSFMGSKSHSLRDEQCWRPVPQRREPTQRSRARRPEMLKMVDFLFCVFCYNIRKRDPHVFGPETTLPHPCLGVPGTRQALRGEEAGAGPPVPEEAASDPPSQLRPRRTPTPGTAPSVSWATAEGAAPPETRPAEAQGAEGRAGGWRGAARGNRGGGRDTVPLGPARSAALKPRGQRGPRGPRPCEPWLRRRQTRTALCHNGQATPEKSFRGSRRT